MIAAAAEFLQQRIEPLALRNECGRSKEACQIEHLTGRFDIETQHILGQQYANNLIHFLANDRKA